MNYMEVDEVRLASYEAKMLLLKDLSSRIPYSPKIKTLLVTDSKVVEVPVTNNLTADKVGVINTWAKGCEPRYIYIPYLFPLSSMTKEQKKFFDDKNIECDGWEIVSKEGSHYQSCYTDIEEWLEVIDWLNKNHFDYRNLINKNLAIDCTNLEIYK